MCMQNYFQPNPVQILMKALYGTINGEHYTDAQKTIIIIIPLALL